MESTFAGDRKVWMVFEARSCLLQYLLQRGWSLFVQIKCNDTLIVFVEDEKTGFCIGKYQSSIPIQSNPFHIKARGYRAQSSPNPKSKMPSQSSSSIPNITRQDKTRLISSHNPRNNNHNATINPTTDQTLTAKTALA